MGTVREVSGGDEEEEEERWEGVEETVGDEGTVEEGLGEEETESGGCTRDGGGRGEGGVLCSSEVGK